MKQVQIQLRYIVPTVEITPLGLEHADAFSLAVWQNARYAIVVVRIQNINVPVLHRVLHIQPAAIDHFALQRVRKPDQYRLDIRAPHKIVIVPAAILACAGEHERSGRQIRLKLFQRLRCFLSHGRCGRLRCSRRRCYARGIRLRRGSGRCAGAKK
ncbi:hypothetical protein SDC9_187359 [bioreactor metagenome]|uniref:Uncharacterized protein n=1 Tax=bioreactor metagenome TaxID=1076179 RepID=A0A645HLC2_9ZZZZ